MSTARTRWLSGRSLLLHLLALLAVPLCLLAGWWQATRAMSGNTLSYFYAIEWPIFAVLAVCGWWQLLHIPPADSPSDRAGQRPAPAAGRPPGEPLTWDPRDETPALRAYNEYLAALPAGASRPPRRRRRRSGPPVDVEEEPVK